SLSRSYHLPDLHSFPTRRSSDLKLIKQSLSLFLSGCLMLATASGGFAAQADQSSTPPPVQAAQQTPEQLQQLVAPIALYPDALRSEEHTSELQSLAYLVCRLLLE